MHIKQSSHMATKFIEPNPLNRVVFGTSDMGPATKNLARLSDPANELRRKDIIGRASTFIEEWVVVRCPSSLVPKSVEVNMSSANDICD